MKMESETTIGKTIRYVAAHDSNRVTGPIWPGELNEDKSENSNESGNNVWEAGDKEYENHS